jgi:hypothetical protein
MTASSDARIMMKLLCSSICTTENDSPQSSMLSGIASWLMSETSKDRNARSKEPGNSISGFVRCRLKHPTFTTGWAITGARSARSKGEVDTYDEDDRGRRLIFQCGLSGVQRQQDVRRNDD